jgi:hypothetical protein
MNRMWSREDIAELLNISDLAVAKAVVAIYHRQTADEKDAQTTKHRNGVGFNGVDAILLSSFARQVIGWQKGRSQYPGPLGPRQVSLARKKIVKYAGQLAEIANARV